MSAEPEDHDALDRMVISYLLYGSLGYAISYTIFNYFQSYIDKLPSLLLFIYSILLLFLLLLRNKMKTLTILLIFFCCVILSILVLAILLGAESNIQFYFISIVLGAPFLFRGKKYLTIFGTIIPLIIFVIIHHGQWSGISLLDKNYYQQNPIIPLLNLIGTALFLGPELIYLAIYINGLIIKLEKSENETRKLLSNLIPDSILHEYKRQNNFYAEQKEDAVVIFMDIVGFTELCLKYDANHIVNLLHKIFSEIDTIAERYHIEKIKTIGDCYMAAANVLGVDEKAFKNCANFALEVQQYTNQFQGEIRMRIGIAQGQLIAGAIGKKRIFFDIWGSSVNLAARIQHAAQPGKIACSSSFYDSTKKFCNYAEPQVVNVKGIGVIQLYELVEVLL
ncbi:MAG: adenylate/guanylate cyclase domain-containing protein [Leptospiraceae bacterium]|nr:adenylate/guanylate cyclase domain-containing protein [Leptospiraceae bacterium]